MRMLLTAAAILLALTGCGDSTGPEEGAGGENTYTVDGFTFTWEQSPVSEDLLIISVTAPATGWVAVGFEPSTYMENSNLIIGYVDQDIPSVRDDFGTGPVTHDADVNLGGTSDVNVISGSETSGETTISFSLPYDSGDIYDKPLAEGNTYTFIFAYGADGSDDFTSSHVWAETASFEL